MPLIYLILCRFVGPIGEDGLRMGRRGKRGRGRLSGDLDHRRQGNADSLKQGTGASGSGGAEAKPSAGLIDVGLHDLIEVADDIGPFESTAGSGETIDQFL